MRKNIIRTGKKNGYTCFMPWSIDGRVANRYSWNIRYGISFANRERADGDAIITDSSSRHKIVAFLF